MECQELLKEQATNMKTKWNILRLKNKKKETNEPYQDFSSTYRRQRYMLFHISRNKQSSLDRYASYSEEKYKNESKESKHLLLCSKLNIRNLGSK